MDQHMASRLGLVRLDRFDDMSAGLFRCSGPYAYQVNFLGRLFRLLIHVVKPGITVKT